MAAAEGHWSLQVRKFLSNPLLQRKQFVVEVLHPGMANVSKAELKDKLARRYKVQDPNSIILFGFHTAFGGGRSSGFGLIYDNVAAAKRFEKKYRLIRAGLEESKTRTGRRATKELKNRKKKLRGIAKAKATVGKKK